MASPSKAVIFGSGHQSNEYISDTQFNPSLEQNTNVSVTNQTTGDLEYTNLDYQSILFAKTDVSGFTHLYVEYDNNGFTGHKLSLISLGAENPVTLDPHNGFDSMDIPLRLYTVADLTNVYKLKTDGGIGNSITFKQIYFYTKTSKNFPPANTFEISTNTGNAFVGEVTNMAYGNGTYKINITNGKQSVSGKNLGRLYDGNWSSGDSDRLLISTSEADAEIIFAFEFPEPITINRMWVSNNHDAGECDITIGTTTTTKTLIRVLNEYQYVDIDDNATASNTVTVKFKDHSLVWFQNSEIFFEATTAPTITITGDATVVVETGATYTEQGATSSETVTVGGDTVDTLVEGTYTITYSATDEAGNTGTDTRTVIVKSESGPFVVNNHYPLYDFATGAEGHLGGNGGSHEMKLNGVTYYMPNGVTNWHGNYPNPTFTIVGQPSNGTVSVNGEQVTYTPNTDFIGVDTFTYSVTINGLTSANVATSTVRVYPDEVTLTGEPKTGETLTANADLVLNGLTAPTYVWKRDGVAIAEQTAATYTLQPEDAGATITVTATFTHEGTIEKELSKSEGPIQSGDDEAPVITFQGANPLHIAKDSTFSYDDLEKAVSDNVDPNPTVTRSGDDVDTSTPGDYTITYTATDAAGNSASASRVVTVDGEETGPKEIDGYYPLYDTISGANANGNGGSHEMKLNEATYYMPNGLTNGVTQWHGTYNDLVFTIVSQPTHGALHLDGTLINSYPKSFTTGTLRYHPNENYHGSDSFTYKAWQSGVESAEATVSITVTSVNDAPTFNLADNTQSVNAFLGVAKEIVLAAATDVEDDTLTYEIDTPPTKGTVTIVENKATYTATEFGNDTFKYKVKDRKGAVTTAEATVNITTKLRSFQDVVSEMSLSMGDNTIAEPFTLSYDLTKTYVTAQKALVANSLLGYSDDAVRAGLVMQYGAAYYAGMHDDDKAAAGAIATNPIALTKVALPYLDNDHYTLTLDNAAKTWALKYSNGHAILSGLISFDGKILTGEPIMDGGMIEFPVSQGGVTGVRTVDASSGAGKASFTLNAAPTGYTRSGHRASTVNTSMENVIDDDFAEDTKGVTLNASFFGKFPLPGTDSGKREQWKTTMRAARRQFRSKLYGKGVRVSKDHAYLQKSLRHKAMVRYMNVKDLDEAKEVVMKTKTNGGDLEEDEGLFLDLEDDGDEVTLKLGDTDDDPLKPNKVHIKKKKIENTNTFEFIVTETVAGGVQVIKDNNNNNPTAGFSSYLGKMEYTLGSVTAELDETKPVISSGSVATTLVENSDAGQTVYIATAQMSAADPRVDATVTYSLAETGDHASFTIDGSSGAVTLTASPDYDVKPSYTFTVTATDAAGNESHPKTVSLTITNLDEVAPTFTSLATVPAINENSGAGQVIYTAQATNNDTDDVASPSITYSLAETGDYDFFSINPTSGAVTLTANPDHEAKPSYNFTVIATDQSNNVSQALALSLTINNLDESAPTFTSPTTVTSINENSGAGQVIYIAQATDNADTSAGITYSLAETDAAFFTINATSGKVTLTANPDFETKSQYVFAVVASDGVQHTQTQDLTLFIINLDESAPTITVENLKTAIDENSGANQLICNVTADDSNDISDGVTFSLEGADAAFFSIDANSGEVRFIEDPNYEAIIEERTNPIYTYVVKATDAAGNRQTQQLTLAINNMDELAPEFTSPTTITPIREHTGANQVIYTATALNRDVATNPVQMTFELGGTDHTHFNINETTGAVTLLADPVFETKSSYSFIITANDGTHTQNLPLTLDVDNYSVNFVLPALNSEMTTSMFNLVTIGNLEEILEMDHLLEFNVAASNWNDLFWLSPDANGLEVDTTLNNLDVFKNEKILYHTKPENLDNNNVYAPTNNDKADITKELATLYYKDTSVNDITPTELETADACIKFWSKDIFKIEHMDDIWANRATVKQEIDNFITNPVGQSGLMEKLKVIVQAANGLSNVDDSASNAPQNIAKSNLTRQLLIQLHGAIANGDFERRLLNMDADISIFHPDNSEDVTVDGVTSKYFAFKFVPGDTLSFGMIINHPDAYKTTGADYHATDANMTEDAESNNQGAFDGGDAPRAMRFKIKLTMTE